MRDGRRGGWARDVHASFVETLRLVFTSVPGDCSLKHHFYSWFHVRIALVNIVRTTCYIPRCLHATKNTQGSCSRYTISYIYCRCLHPSKKHLRPRSVRLRVFRCTPQQLRPRFPPPRPPTSPVLRPKNAFARRWQAPQSPRWMA